MRRRRKTTAERLAEDFERHQEYILPRPACGEWVYPAPTQRCGLLAGHGGLHAAGTPVTEWVTPRRLTSGVPAAPDLSPTEAATVARFDAAPDAEESLRERVAQAIWEATPGSLPWAELHPRTRSRKQFRDLADAAIAVMRGDDA